MNGKRTKVFQKHNNLTSAVSDTGISNESDNYNYFYDHISVFYRILSLVLIVAFLFYIVFTSFNNAAEFSYENFEYIVRNFALSLEENKDDSVYSIKYNPDSNRHYALFGKGLAVCGNSGISIFSATGRLTCSDSFPYKNPRIASSDKYVLVYDYSGSEYSIYNAFSRAYSEKISEVIRGAAVSDDGYYALITSSEKYNTAVELYDDTFSLINKFNKNGFVVDIDINNTYLIIATASESADNSFVADIQVFDIAEQCELFSVSSENNFPLECGFTADGFALVGNNYAEFYSLNGSIVATYDYDGKVPFNFSLKREGIVILFKDQGYNSKYTAVVLNDFGEVQYTQEYSTTVYDVEICREWSYYLTEQKLICTDGSTVHEFELDGIVAGNSLLSSDQGEVYICTDTEAPLFILPSN